MRVVLQRADVGLVRRVVQELPKHVEGLGLRAAASARRVSASCVVKACAFWWRCASGAVELLLHRRGHAARRTAARAARSAATAAKAAESRQTGCVEPSSPRRGRRGTARARTARRPSPRSRRRGGCSASSTTGCGCGAAGDRRGRPLDRGTGRRGTTRRAAGAPARSDARWPGARRGRGTRSRRPARR